MMKKKLYIETLGCAMNERDSEHIISELETKENYEVTLDFKEADLILINTCSVRDKPERKLFSEIGQFTKHKKLGAKIGICGCTASHLGKEIIRKAPSVDFVLGARNVSKITQIIHQPKAVEIDIDYDDSSYIFNTQYKNPYKAMINISIGCDKACAYCIVPKTRGSEISIPADLILKEANKIVQSGISEILLIGQNVNNYGKSFSNEHKKMNFTDLLKEFRNIDGLERLRFVSPHPLHMDDEFLEEFASNPKVCKSIHIPLQSGSTRILKLMKRGYTQEWFINRVDKLRKLVPDVTLSTDIIVGFPFESDEDFEETMKVVEIVKFDSLFSFVYSPRPHTEAGGWEERVSSEISEQRLKRLQDRHRVLLHDIAKKELGKIHKVLVEKNNDEMFEGKTDTAKVVHFPYKLLNESILGKILNIKIIEVNKANLLGKVV